MQFLLVAQNYLILHSFGNEGFVHYQSTNNVSAVDTKKRFKVEDPVLDFHQIDK